jgi:hypothetical protein
LEDVGIGGHNIKIDLEMRCEDAFWIHMVQGQVLRFCEHSNETADSINVGVFLD